ncbi:MAG TPA: FtsW/RodA/SpoVE family cell cycle protein [Tenericutes bacterium]|nr:FtsW/RodA/SpoVE family cell cycle protein [Mycoplasmatota bacterium]
MNNISRFKVDKWLFISMILLASISILIISSAQTMLPSYLQSNYALKQVIWFVLGFVIIYSIMIVDNEFIYRFAWPIYIIGVLSLIFLYFAPASIAPIINGAKCWFKIPIIGGTIQPSEFMKIALIIVIAKIINDHGQKVSDPSMRDELMLILKVLVVTLIPSILTFLQPDTGIVVIYLVISVVMLFVGGISYRWFIIFGLIGILGIGFVLLLHTFNRDLFISLLGTSFFYRVERLLSWFDQSGMQLENALISMGSAGLFGHGFGNNVIYFPEAHTDFIFSVWTSNFGFLGAAILITIIIFFDFKLIQTAMQNDERLNVYVMSGIISMLVFQQIQNIGMNIGLLPIVGITLPFISYGGSSLLSYMIMMGLVYNTSNENLKFTNKTTF